MANPRQAFVSKRAARHPRRRTVPRARDSHSERTREALMQAARTLFAAKGFNGATVKEIADAAGVNISLVSYHFNGKEGLFRACMEQFGRRRLEASERILKGPSSAEEFRLRLKMFAENTLQMNVDEPDCCKIINRDVDMESPICEDIFRNTFLKSYTNLLGFFRAAEEKGLFRDGVDTELTPGFFFGSLIHLIRSESLAKKHFHVSLADDAFRERVTRELVRVFCAGLLKEERR